MKAAGYKIERETEEVLQRDGYRPIQPDLSGVSLPLELSETMDALAHCFYDSSR